MGGRGDRGGREEDGGDEDDRGNVGGEVDGRGDDEDDRVLPYPEVPEDLLTGWEPVDCRRETLFEVRSVRVRAATVVHEDEAMADRVADAAGVDVGRTWRFFFASRVELRPETPVTGMLTRLVTNRAGSGFADQLRDRGFEDVDPGRTREFRVGDVDATLRAYDARVRYGGLTLAVDGWLAVWPDDPGFLIAGGAYPTAVLETSGGREAAARALREEVSPGAYRDELFGLIRATGDANGREKRGG